MPKKFIARTNKQNSALHKLLGQRGFTDDDKAEMVLDVTKGRTERSSEMSVAECDSMIERLGGSAVVARRVRHTPALPQNVIALVTADQRDKLAKLRAARSMTDAGFERLCRSTIKKPEPRTLKDAQKIIEAIKAMMQREKYDAPVTVAVNAKQEAA